MFASVVIFALNAAMWWLLYQLSIALGSPDQLGLLLICAGYLVAILAALIFANRTENSNRAAVSLIVTGFAPFLFTALTLGS